MDPNWQPVLDFLEGEAEWLNERYLADGDAYVKAATALKDGDALLARKLLKQRIDHVAGLINIGASPANNTLRANKTRFESLLATISAAPEALSGKANEHEA